MEKIEIIQTPEVTESAKFELKQNDRREDLYYVLAMFAYPSGVWMHMWHVLNYSSTDAIARFNRYKWKKSLHPTGWDSFGLPTENFAMKVWKSAYDVTEENVANFVKQAKTMNLGYDWSREINTSSPEYYKWTQWIFKKLYEHGLAYRKEEFVNWCPSCNTVLANDQIIDSRCERCDTDVIQKKMDQWFIKITDYADRLIEDLKNLDWPEETKKAQINWIGRKWWYDLFFMNDLKVFVEEDNIANIWNIKEIKIAPEHSFLDNMLEKNNLERLENFRKKISKKSLLEREHLMKKEYLLDFSVFVKNPVSWKELKIIVDGSVLPNYAYGAKVIFDENENWLNKSDIKKLEEKEIIKKSKIYKLRDWSVSRQRYWWCPIPIYYDENNQAHLIPEEELPVKLPLDVKNYKPTWKSPLEEHPTFSKYKKDWKKYKRECDTLDTFVDSSFYYLRYLDLHNDQNLISPEIAEKISDVDFYIWWKEHSVWHLLYARFIHKFLYDIGVVKTKEPFKKLFHQWMILAPDGRKMSKRWWNVIDPLDMVKKYSHDVLKMWILFMWPLEKTKPWNEDVLKWIDNFLNKVLSFVENTNFPAKQTEEEKRILSKYIKWITSDIERIRFNTAISKMMVLLSELRKLKGVSKKWFNQFLIMLSVFAPDTANILWKEIWNKENIFEQKWPELEKNSNIEKQENKVAFQLNGKFKNQLVLPSNIKEEEIVEWLKENWYWKYLEWKEIRKLIYKPSKVLNLVFNK